MPEIIIPFAYSLFGVAAYSFLIHLQIGLRRPTNLKHLMFAAICFCTSLSSVFQSMILRADNIAVFVFASRWNHLFVSLMLICMIWFAAIYTKIGSKAMLIGFTTAFILIIFATLSQPYGLQFDQIIGLKKVNLPWGEAYSNAEGKVSLIYKMALLTLMAALLYVVFAFFSLARSEPTRSNINMLMAASFFVICYLQGALVRTGVIEFLPMGPIGILGFIIAMSMALNQENTDEHEAVTMAIEQERKRLNTILKTSSDDIYIIDSDGLLVEANHSFLHNLGLDESAIGHLHVSDLNAQFDHMNSMQQIQVILNSDDKVTFETQHKCSDGSTIEVEVYANSFDFNGARYVSFATRDITERKANQHELERRITARTEELATTRAEAETANAVKTSILTNVSHEMRTQMCSVLGFAEISKLKGEKQGNEAFGEYFEMILRAGKNLNELIESLLILAQDELDRKSVISDEDLQEVRPELLIIECIAFMQRTASIKQQKIVFENSSTIPVIYADPSKLRQVLEELLNNALYYSPQQTTVTIKIQDNPVNSELPTGISIQVIDEGCGIPESEKNAIFEPFYQSTRTASGAGGTGLGLPLCKNIVLRHRGVIAVSNRPQGGAVFEITLPKNCK